MACTAKAFRKFSERREVIQYGCEKQTRTQPPRRNMNDAVIYFRLDERKDTRTRIIVFAAPTCIMSYYVRVFTNTRA